MMGVERIQRIKEYIAANKYATIDELSKEFDTSPATIRRSLKQLERDHVVESIRGGARLASGGNMFEYVYSVKSKQNIEEKKRIAEAAIKHIEPGSGIYLDSSSTVYEIVNFIEGKENISFCTNDVMIANALNMRSDNSVIVIGGKLRCGYNTMVGYMAENMMRDLRVDAAFIGVDAIDADGDIMITNSEELGIKKAAMRVANHVYILCDHTKINKTALVNICNARDVDLIITGQELSTDVYEAFTEMGINITLV